MGRWGHRLFEGDQDLDEYVDVAEEFKKKNGSPEIAWFFENGPADMLLGRSSGTQTGVADSPESAKLETVRRIVDSGLGATLMREFREKENGNSPWAKYRVIILGAILMRMGAQIAQDDIDHLRQLALATPSREGFALAFSDIGFRGPGLRQFLAALNHYQSGTPRNFETPSCFACGKINCDIGRGVMQCGRCHSAWFCDKDCQRSYWRNMEDDIWSFEVLTSFVALQMSRYFSGANYFGFL
ncbi:hypothetical protein OQA88_622 [Cercophora sp. LCS_1]